MPFARRHALRPVFRRVFAALVLAGLIGGAPARASDQPPTAPPSAIPEIVVTARFRPEPVAEVPASVSVLDEPVIESAAVQHFEELAGLIPNLNWSGEGSRARYFQIRGTGELEQYEGAPNPSIGFVIDDIDLSGIGGVATTFDTRQVEVLRGPQGTRYGANALAGLVNVRTNDPTPDAAYELQATGGNDDTYSVGAVASGPVAGTDGELGYRVALQDFHDDGFRHNAWLGRDDTNGRDEFTGRAKLRWQPSEHLRVDVTGLYMDLDNGYDAFAVDNGYTTYSDKPGRDTQQTSAGALRVEADLNPAITLVDIATFAHSDIRFGFDADWGSDDFWGDVVYDYTQEFRRTRDSATEELRFQSGPDGRILGSDWVVGAWLERLTESNERQDLGCDVRPCPPAYSVDRAVASDYGATSKAVFAAVDHPFTDATTLSLGLRFEERDAGYDDRTDDAVAGCEFANHFGATDRMAGGELTLAHQVEEGVRTYARIARGYKAGGFNPGIAAYDCNSGPQDLSFDPEYLWNYEVGVRLAGPGNGWTFDASVFWQDRQDPQLKIPAQAVLGDPTTFLFYTTNAGTVRIAGAEVQATWRPVDSLDLTGALGLLDTNIDSFPDQPDLEGHALAHAPAYTFALSATWHLPDGYYARIDETGKDRFVIDYCQAAGCDDPHLPAYQLTNLRIGREWGHWRVDAWCENLFDKDYAKRGFYFVNEPPFTTPKLYTRLGDPRHAGITLTWRFE